MVHHLYCMSSSNFSVSLDHIFFFRSAESLKHFPNHAQTSITRNIHTATGNTAATYGGDDTVSQHSRPSVYCLNEL